MLVTFAVLECNELIWTSPFRGIPHAGLYRGRDAGKDAVELGKDSRDRPTSARRILFPTVWVRYAIHVDLGRIMTWQKSRDSNITWRQEEKDQE